MIGRCSVQLIEELNGHRIDTMRTKNESRPFRTADAVHVQEKYPRSGRIHWLYRPSTVAGSGRCLHTGHQLLLASRKLLADTLQIHVALAQLGKELAFLFLDMMLHVFTQHRHVGFK